VRDLVENEWLFLSRFDDEGRVRHRRRGGWEVAGAVYPD
jgi:hypothetical protein